MAAKLANLDGAALCAVSILDAGRSHFTVVHVAGKNPECMAIMAVGMQLPALQAAAAHQPSPPGGAAGAELRYNSLQVLQLLQVGRHRRTVRRQSGVVLSNRDVDTGG